MTGRFVPAVDDSSTIDRSSASGGSPEDAGLVPSTVTVTVALTVDAPLVAETVYTVVLVGRTVPLPVAGNTSTVES